MSSRMTPKSPLSLKLYGPPHVRFERCIQLREHRIFSWVWKKIWWKSVFPICLRPPSKKSFSAGCTFVSRKKKIGDKNTWNFFGSEVPISWRQTDVEPNFFLLRPFPKLFHPVFSASRRGVLSAIGGGGKRYQVGHFFRPNFWSNTFFGFF